MLVFPAVDLIDGKCVRLTHGDFETSKVYYDNPLEMLTMFKQHGFKWAHVVDLDGAKDGNIKQINLIKQLVTTSGLDIQVGGGIRTSADILKLFDYGVNRVVLGSICVSDPNLVKKWLNIYGSDRIVLALDCYVNSNGIPIVKTNGWQTDSNVELWGLLDFYSTASYVLCTDVSVDGTLLGSNIDLYRQFVAKYPKINLIASGGVSSLDDLTRLNELGIYGVVVGKAIYEGNILLSQIEHFSLC